MAKIYQEIYLQKYLVSIKKVQNTSVNTKHT